jgi:hypothetical protein
MVCACHGRYDTIAPIHTMKGMLIWHYNQLKHFSQPLFHGVQETSSLTVDLLTYIQEKKLFLAIETDNIFSSNHQCHSGAIETSGFAPQEAFVWAE